MLPTPYPHMKSVQQRMASGIIWMVAARLVDRCVGVASTLVLARLLVPADFGLVAMATAIGGILDLLGAFNFDLALIQRKDAGRSQYDTVWTFNVLFGVFCALVLVLLATPASHYYHEARLVHVMYALALMYVIGGLTNVGTVDFRKDLQFHNEFQFIVQRRVITFVVTVTCAFLFRSYWALIAGMLVGRFFSTVMSYSMSAYRPRYCLSAARELFHFSKWLFVNNTLYFLLHRGPTFIIGRISGATGLGVYTVAYEISNLPSTELVAPINRATFPGFSQMRNIVEIAASYLSLLGVITLIVLPIGAGIATVADPLVRTTLGAQWLDAIPLIQLLALFGAISATQSNNGIVWLALGYPRELTLQVVLFLVVFFPAIYICLELFGTLGIGYAYLIAQVSNLPFGLWNTKRRLELRWRQMVSVTWRPVVSVSVMCVTTVLLSHQLTSMNPWGQLLVEVGFGAIVYCTTVLATWLASGRPESAEVLLMKRLAKLMGR